MVGLLFISVVNGAGVRRATYLCLDTTKNVDRNWDINVSFIIHVNFDHSWVEHYLVMLKSMHCNLKEGRHVAWLETCAHTSYLSSIPDISYSTNLMYIYRCTIPNTTRALKSTYPLCTLHTKPAVLTISARPVMCMSRRHMTCTEQGQWLWPTKTCYLSYSWALPDDSKHTEADFWTVSTDSLHLRFAQVSRSQDLAILCWRQMTDKADSFTPCTWKLRRFIFCY